MDMSAREACGRATNFNQRIAFVTEQGQEQEAVGWALGGCRGVPAGCADARRLEASQIWCSSTPLEAFLGSLTRRRGAAQLSAKYNVLLHVTLVAFVRASQRIPLPWTTTIFTPNACYVVSTHVDRKSTRLNSSHSGESRMPSSA